MLLSWRRSSLNLAGLRARPFREMCGFDVGIGVGGIDDIAYRWKREFGGAAGWHLRAKIARLRDWGDDAGADLHQLVLDHCEGRTPAVPGRPPFRFRWPVIAFRRSA